MNERRTILRRLGMAGAALAATVSGVGVATAKDNKPVPPGQPFQRLLELIKRLQQRLRRLASRVHNLEQTKEEVNQLRIYNPPGPNRLFFGPTDDCSVETNPQGPPGLLLRDPMGVRLLSPPAFDDGGLVLAADQAPELNPPTLFFGPTDECRIRVGPELDAGLIFEDPNGVLVRSTNLDEGGSLAIGALDCRIKAGGPNGGLGMIFEDPNGFLFQLPMNVASSNDVVDDASLVKDTSLAIGASECRLRAGGGNGMIFEDPNGFLFQSFNDGKDASLAIGASECRIRAGGGGGMIFEDPEGFLFNNVVKAEKFVQTSSGQFKKNVRPIDDALDKIKALQGVYFDWKTEKGGHADVGFIGEAVEGVLPEVVATGKGETDVVGVAYGNVVAVAVEGIKAQQTELERLQQDNGDLRNEVQALRERLEAISQKIDGA